MAVEIGTASGHIDLLNKLVTFLTTNPDLVAANQQWEVLPTTESSQVVLRGQGLAGQDEIYLTLSHVMDAANDVRNIGLRYATGYNPNTNEAGQPGASTIVYATLWNQSIPYWFVANGRRFIVIAKVSTVYACLYGGFILPYGLPSEYPYPICVGGNGAANLRWSVSSTQIASFWNPRSASASTATSHMLKLRDTVGTERRFFNQNSGSSESTHSYTIPYARAGGSWISTGPDNQHDFRTSPDGKHVLQPVILTTSIAEAQNVWGEFDGVYHVSGFQNASENIIAYNGEDYLVVQSSNRTTMHDYAAIRLV